MSLPTTFFCFYSNFTPLLRSKCKNQKTIDMRKTLLTALKHGSGTILILLAMMLGGGLQAWGDVTVTKGEKIRVNTNDHGWFKNGNTYPRLYLLNSTSSDDGAVMIGEAGSYNSDNIYFITVNIDTETKTGSYLEVRRYTTDETHENNPREFYVDSRNTGYSSLYLNSGGSLEWERCFSTGDKFYLLNNASYYVGTDNQLWFQNGTNGKAWIHMWSNPSSGTYDAEFTLLSGSKETSGAIYQAGVNGCYAHFLITRNSSESTGPFNNKWNESANFSIPPTNNRITGTTSSSYSSDFYDPCNNPTVTAGAYSSLTSSSVTIAATVTAAESDPCELSKVGVDVYTDQACSSSAGVSKEVSYVGSDYSITGVDVSSLSPNVKYYYKTYAKRSSDNAKVYSSNIGSFVMPCLSGVNEATLTSTVETVCLGSATALGVAGSGVVGGVYTYQWYYNSSASTSGAVAIPGATSNSYTPAVVGDNYYYCGIAADGGYCEVPSQFSKLVTIKGVPVITASASSVTNYVPVTLTATGVESTNWSITSGEGGYLYDTNSTTVKFKGNVGSSSDPLTYTIQATSNGCSGTANVTVSRNSDNCQ